MASANEIINIAAAEVGYLEKKSLAALDDKTANAGYANITKYWRDLCPKFQGQPWCDVFVSWVFVATYGTEKANYLLCGGVNSYYTPTSAQFYQQCGRLDKTPKAGDQIFFSKDETVDNVYHTGIVEKYDGTWVHTIEGNTSNTSGVVPNGGCVLRKKYLYLSFKNKIFFGHPKYDDVPAPVPKKVHYAVQIRVSTFLNVRTGASTQSPIMQVNGEDFTLPNGLVVAILEELNGWGRLNDINGWIYLAYAKRLN